MYDTVAARDTVDHNRNVLFHRARDSCQLLTLKDPCLQLTGPSRSVVATDPVDFEIQLKVKGSRRKASEDRVLMRQTFVYRASGERARVWRSCNMVGGRGGSLCPTPARASEDYSGAASSRIPLLAIRTPVSQLKRKLEWPVETPSKLPSSSRFRRPAPRGEE